MAVESGLQIGIVGAGVAGLSAAIGLRKAGHRCEVFERSQFRNETGAAVSLTPNGGKILSRWGFDVERAHGIQCSQVRRPKGDSLEPMAPTLDFSKVEEKYGENWNFYHRADMHKQLREMVTSSDIPGSPGVINLGCQVVDIDLEQGNIVLKDGRIIQKDLIIVADGQHDQLNYKITGQSIPMQKSGQTAYRCLIPMSEILADPITKPLFENQPFGFWAPALPQKGVMCVTYPCRNGEILNCLIVSRRLGQHAASTDDAAIEDWNFPATREQLEAVMEGFHPAVKTLMLKSSDTKMYTQMKRQPLPKMFKGKAVLVGDACHPMLLTHAQGVSSSIEDGAALEVLLRNVPASASVASPPSDLLTARLELFEKLRLPRVAATQIMTDPVLPGPHAAAAYVKMEAAIREHYAGELPPMNSMPHSPPICNFFFGYDVVKEAEKVLADSELESHSAPEVAVVDTAPATPQADPVLSKLAAVQVAEVTPFSVAAASNPSKPSSFWHGIWTGGWFRYVLDVIRSRGRSIIGLRSRYPKHLSDFNSAV